MDRTALRELHRTLYWLRWCAVIGQSVSVLFALHWLHLDLPLAPLAWGVAILIATNLALTPGLRAIRTPGLALFGLQLAIDLGVLTWQLYWTGGPINPFASLYLLPIALIATALPASAVIATAVAAAIGYSGLMLYAQPLPHAAGHSGFDLHVIGMWVNFLLSTALLTVFVMRLAARINGQREQLAQARERALRNEGLLSLAVQAAGTAHAINTPLATMAVLVDELRDERTLPTALHGDMDLLGRQIAICRDAIRRLAASARGEPTAVTDVDAWLRGLTTRWSLLRPQLHTVVTLAPALARVPVAPAQAIDHVIVNLFDNAADASLAAGEEWVALDATCTDDTLRIEIRDRGIGIDATTRGAFGSSSKPDGMGIGLALSNATLDRCGGSLEQFTPADGGTCTRVLLPLTTLRAMQAADA